MTVAECIADILKERESPLVCGLPGGGSNLDLVEATRRRGIPFVLTATESASVMIAATLADLSGHITAVVATLGPGVANAVNGVAHAFLDRLPVLFISDAYGDRVRQFARRQNLQHAALLAPVTKWSTRLTAASVERSVRYATAVAMTAPRGPVHIDLPTAVALAPASGGGDRASAHDPPANPLTEERLDRAVDVIQRRRHPVILAGLEVRSREAAAGVLALAEALGAPVLTTYRGKGALPEDHPLAGGIFTGGLVERGLVDRADLIIAVGLDPVELLPQEWSYRAPVLSLRESPDHGTHVPLAAEVVGPLERILEPVAECARRATDPEPGWEGEATRFRKGTIELLTRALENGPRAGGLSPNRVVEIARAAGPREALATADSGAHMFATAYLWDTFAPRTYLCSGGLATMGFALPGAVAAAFHSPGRPVFSFTGDAGFLMNLPDLAIVATLRPQLIVVIFADQWLSLIRLKQQQRRLAGASLGLPPIAWARIAEGFGMRTYAVESEQEYERALGSALSSTGPTIIGVRVDPTNYGAASRLLRG